MGLCVGFSKVMKMFFVALIHDRIKEKCCCIFDFDEMMKIVNIHN
jgi:hypothetical protein